MKEDLWPAPNLILLNNALRQTGWTGPLLTTEAWRSQVRERLVSVEWAKIVADVRPFLESPAEVDLLTPETVIRLLR